MTNFYIGQKVRYLNQVGQGIIRKIDSKKIIVEDDSGFEIPFLINELVPANKEEIVVDYSTSKAVYTAQQKNEPNITKKFLSDGIYILFAPIKNQNFEALLVNKSGFDISINIYLTDKNTNRFIKNLFVREDNSQVIQEIQASEIGDWQHISAQIMFSKTLTKNILETVIANKKIDGKKFFDTKNYVLTIYSQVPVFELCIYSESMKEEDVKLSSEELQRLLNQKENHKHSKPSLPHNIYHQELELEVDLHIEELVENYTIYTPSALLQIQMNKVKAELSKAMTNSVNKITFIHGVGKGVLKQEIKNYLSTVEGIKFYDGAMSKYGFGATTVEIL